MIALRPSAAGIWSVCSGYLVMTARYPETDADNEIREEGLAAHWAASQLLAGRQVAEGTIAPNGVELTDEMLEAIAVYTDSLQGSMLPDARIEVETQLDCSLIYPGMSGTPDATIFLPPSPTSRGLLVVADLKFGYRIVQAYGNLQLAIYALAKAQSLRLPDTSLVEMRIVQPRVYHPNGHRRSWTMTHGELRSVWLPKLREAAAKAVVGGTLTTSAACGDCSARHACPALREASLSMVDYSAHNTQMELPSSAIGMELLVLEAAADRIEARLTGLRAMAEAQLREGITVPGWKLARKTSRERWKEGAAEQIIKLGAFFGVTTAKPPAPVTPRQARKLLPSTVVNDLSERPTGSMVVVKQSKDEVRELFSQQPEQ